MVANYFKPKDVDLTKKMEEYKVLLLTYSLTHSLIHSFTHSLTHSLTYSLPYSLLRELTSAHL